MSRKYWRGREIDPGRAADEEPDPLGPDGRDQDLLEEGGGCPPPYRRASGPSPLMRYGVLALSLIAAASILVPMIAAVRP